MRLRLTLVGVAAPWMGGGGDPGVSRGRRRGGERARGDAAQGPRVDPDKLRHAFVVEATMEKLAVASGGDPARWEIAGLLHDIDLADTALVGEQAQHGIVGARLLKQLGYDAAVVHAIAAHDDAAGVARTAPIDHALHCADRVYWAIHASGLRFPSPEATGATAASVLAGLERRGITDRIDDALRRECGQLGLDLDDVLGLALEAFRDRSSAME